MDPVINLVAVLVGAIASMVIGMIWYGPLFGKTWMNLMGINKSKMKDATKSYLIQFVGAIVMVYVLAHFVQYAGAKDIIGGLQTGFWIWLGFIATVGLGSILWDGKPLELYLINMGYHLVTLLIVGTILAVM